MIFIPMSSLIELPAVWAHCHTPEEFNFATKISDGYGFNIKEMDDEQTDRLYEVLSRVIESIESDV